MPTSLVAPWRKHRWWHSVTTLLCSASQDAEHYLLEKEITPAVLSPLAPAAHQLFNTQPALEAVYFYVCIESAWQLIP